MISRLSAFAAAFAIVATASLGVAASAHQASIAAPAKVVRMIRLEPVVVIAKRLPASQR